MGRGGRAVSEARVGGRRGNPECDLRWCAAAIVGAGKPGVMPVHRLGYPLVPPSTRHRRRVRPCPAPDATCPSAPLSSGSAWACRSQAPRCRPSATGWLASSWTRCSSSSGCSMPTAPRWRSIAPRSKAPRCRWTTCAAVPSGRHAGGPSPTRPLPRPATRERVQRAARGEFVRCDVEVFGRAAGEETIRHRLLAAAGARRVGPHRLPAGRGA